jgi:hypothetical protein
MVIKGISVMRGPNVWSNYRRKVIVLRLALEELEHEPTHHIPGFAERISQALPSLYAHRCSEGTEGGFFRRVERGTWMGHVIEHIALELQTLAGMECGYGRTRSTDEKGVYNVVFAYRLADAGVYAAKAAVQVAQCIVGSKDPEIAKHVAVLRNMWEAGKPDPDTAMLIEEAHTRGIPWQVTSGSQLMLGHGCNLRRIYNGLPGTTRGIGIDICSDDIETKEILSSANVPVANDEPIPAKAELAVINFKVEAAISIASEESEPSRDVSNDISEDERAIAERAARLLDLDACTVAIAQSETGESLLSGIKPAVAVSRFFNAQNVLQHNLAIPLMKMIYPHSDHALIPIIAVTGHKAEVCAAIIERFLTGAGKTIGLVTRTGMKVRGQDVDRPVNEAKATLMLLSEPIVESAVIECSVEGIIDSGLAFDDSDMAIICAIPAGKKLPAEFSGKRDLVRIMEVVARTVSEKGWTVLNADDPEILEMRRHIDCKIALFSLDPLNPDILNHCEDGGVAAVFENGVVTIIDGKWKVPIGKESDFSEMRNHKSTLYSVMAAILAAKLTGREEKEIGSQLDAVLQGSSPSIAAQSAAS